MANKDPKDAFKILLAYIRDEYAKVTDCQNDIPWKDMPSYKGCQIAIDVYREIYQKGLELADKFDI